VQQRGSEHGDDLYHADPSHAATTSEKSAPQSELNDPFTPFFKTNHAGGVLGGISSGQSLSIKVAVKPTSSIRLTKQSLDHQGNPVDVSTQGRHDPCVGLRAAPILEAMLALVLMDHALLHHAQCEW